MPPENAEAIARAVAKLCDNPQDIKRMGDIAAESVARDFSADKMTDEILAAYKEVIGAAEVGMPMDGD